MFIYLLIIARHKQLDRIWRKWKKTNYNETKKARKKHRIKAAK